MAGDRTKAGIALQPEWLRALEVTERLPDGARVVFTGCGTSFHAAIAIGGVAVQALDLVEGRGPDADILVAISHEGETALTLEAMRAFDGETWAITAAPDKPVAQKADHVVLATPAIEESYCHTVSYACAVAAGQALRGLDVSGLADEVERAIAADPWPVSAHDRFVVTGAQADLAVRLEAVLKLREGARVAAESHHVEQLLHGHLSAIDESVRCFVIGGSGRGGERARDAARALEILGCDVTVLPTAHPVVAVIPFQRLTVDLADDRGIDPDRIRWDEPLWKAARDSYA